jgi:hypothetical protein
MRECILCLSRRSTVDFEEPATHLIESAARLLVSFTKSGMASTWN